MVRLRFALLLLAALLVSVPAAAQEVSAPRPLTQKLNFASVSFMPVSPDMPAPAKRVSAIRFTEEIGKPAALNTKAEATSRRPSIVMTSLYATTALMQGLDAHSTMKAINRGAVEKNPLMSYLTSHPAAFVALKAGAAAGLIFAGKRLAKRSKTQAIIALAAVNSAYFAIALHNYRVANSLPK